MNKVSPKVESSLLLNLKDIDKMKKGNSQTKMQNKALSIEESLHAYNSKVTKAMEAPVPSIAVHYNEVILRAVPSEMRSKGGIILSLGEEMTDYKVANQVEKMSHGVNQTQEILMVGPLVSEEERERGIRVGRKCKMKLDRFRGLTDHGRPGQIQTEYNIPLETIDGYEYIIIDKRDILYTKD